MDEHRKRKQGFNRGQWIACGIAVAALDLITLRDAGAQVSNTTFLIEEVTDFTGNGCPEGNSGDLNTVTATFRTALTQAGWVGSLFANNAAFPHDFMDACLVSGGDDGNWADKNRLAVYAGHGLASGGSLLFGFPNQGVCNVDLGSQARLGYNVGGQAGVTMYITSCTLTTSTLVSKVNMQWVRQQLGFHDSPSVGNDSARDFFNGTQSSSNRSSWVANMEDRPGFFTGDNSPRVVSYGASATEADNVRSLAKLKGQVFNTLRGGAPLLCSGPTTFFWNTWTIDHGKGPCA